MIYTAQQGGKNKQKEVKRHVKSIERQFWLPRFLTFIYLLSYKSFIIGFYKIKKGFDTSNCHMMTILINVL